MSVPSLAEVPAIQHAPKTRFARGFFCAAGSWCHRTGAAAIVAGASTFRSLIIDAYEFDFPEVSHVL